MEDNPSQRMSQRPNPRQQEEDELRKLMKQWGITLEAAKALRARNKQK